MVLIFREPKDIVGFQEVDFVVLEFLCIIWWINLLSECYYVWIERN